MQSLTGKNTGDTLTAVEWNQLPGEVQNAITSTGQALTNADLQQLVKAIAVYAASGTFYVDSGVTNAYVVASVGTLVPPPGYVLGMEVRFLPGNFNTGVSTVNVASLGVRNIIRRDGSPLLTGDMITGQLTSLFYNGSDFVIFPRGLQNAADLGTGISVDGPILAADGTLTDPGYSFSADTNTGIARIAADMIALVGGGVNRAATLPPASGGLQANNTLTGVGDERVLTESDLAGVGLNNIIDVTGGVQIEDDSGSAPVLNLASDIGTILAVLLGNSGGNMNLQSVVDGNGFLVNGPNSGGALQSLFAADPDGVSELFHAGILIANTLVAASGGLQVNNTLTGVGLERVLTESDISALGVTIDANEIVIAGLARIKYGIDTNTGAGITRVVTFPVAFPTACYGGLSIPYNTGGIDASTKGNVDAFGTANMTIGSATVTGGGNATVAQAMWVAFGE